MKRLDTFDRICLNGIAVMVVGMLAVAALSYTPSADFGKPVNLYKRQAKATSCLHEDWVCLLEIEMLANARPSSGKGGSKQIARAQ